MFFAHMAAGRITRRSLLLAGAGLAGETALSAAALASSETPAAHAEVPVAMVGPARAEDLDAVAHSASLPHVLTGLQAGPGQPLIVARAAWAGSGHRPRVAPAYGSVQLAFVHHTETPNGYGAGEVPSLLRNIYAYHRYGRGWNDIGYNFVIDRFGRIFEARAGGVDMPVVGAQAGGYNVYSTGIALLGSYGFEPISQAARRALMHLIAWKLSLHGAPTTGKVSVKVTRQGAVYSRFPAGTSVSLPRIAGHREADSTDCPGGALYGELAKVRDLAHSLAGRPTKATLALSPSTLLPSALVGELVLLDGTPLQGAAVKVLRRTIRRRGEVATEALLATVATDAAGRWALPLTPSGHAPAPLRAVFMGAQGVAAAVSDPVMVSATLTLAPQPGVEPSAPAQTPPSP